MPEVFRTDFLMYAAAFVRGLLYKSKVTCETVNVWAFIKSKSSNFHGVNLSVCATIKVLFAACEEMPLNSHLYALID